MTLKDVEGAKVAYAQAADRRLEAAREDDGLGGTLFLLAVAEAQQRLADKPMALITLERAREEALRAKSDDSKILLLEGVLEHQRNLDDRDAVAETANRMRDIAKISKSFDEEERVTLLLGLQAKTGDVRGALNALLSTPSPKRPLFSSEGEGPRARFRALALAKILSACRAGDEAILPEILKIANGFEFASARNDVLGGLAYAYARLGNPDESLRTANRFSLDADASYGDPRYQLIGDLLDIAQIQIIKGDVDFRPTVLRAAEVWATFEKAKDRTPPPPRPAGGDEPRPIDFVRESPLPRLVDVLAECGEREQALRLLNKLKPIEQVKALETIAEADRKLKHNDKATAAWTQALDIAKSVSEQDDPQDDKAAPIPSGMQNKEKARVAIVRIHVGLRQVMKAIELVKASGDAREVQVGELIEALGQAGDTPFAFGLISEMTDPRAKAKALQSLYQGLRLR